MMVGFESWLDSTGLPRGWRRVASFQGMVRNRLSFSCKDLWRTCSVFTCGVLI
jgi:hypothetical protein